MRAPIGPGLLHPLAHCVSWMIGLQPRRRKSILARPRQHLPRVCDLHRHHHRCCRHPLVAFFDCGSALPLADTHFPQRAGPFFPLNLRFERSVLFCAFPLLPLFRTQRVAHSRERAREYCAKKFNVGQVLAAHFFRRGHNTRNIRNIRSQKKKQEQ